MTKNAVAVLDASAVLAILFDEEGHQKAARHFPSASMSAVNFSEMVSKLMDVGYSRDQVGAAMQALMLPVEPFVAGNAMEAGQLRGETRHLGLSLGDRACLATAATLNAVVVTADRIWANLDIGVEIEVIR